MTPNPMPANPPAAPAPKKRSGCLTALIVVGILVGLVCLAGGVALFVAARSDTGKKFVSAIDQGVKMAEQGMNAPGAAEIRAAGCPQGLVLDMKQAMKIADIFIDGGLKDDKGEMDFLMVSCAGPYGSELPDCDKVARVYAKAVPSDRPFVVDVKFQGSQKPQCQKKYAGDGKFIEEVK